jgi:hypothetical protein
MSNDKNTTIIEQKANVINNYINNGGKVEVESKSSGEKTPQTITVRPNTEQQQPKVNWQSILPDFQQSEVDKILCNPEKLDLHKHVGEAMLKIEHEQKLKQGNQPAEINEPNIQATPSKKPVAATVDLKNFSQQEKKQLGRIVGADLQTELKEEGVLNNNGKIDSKKLIAESTERWNGTNGKPLQSLPVKDKKYLQTMLGVEDDGLIGPKTLLAAKRAGIIDEKGNLKVNAINEIELKNDDTHYLTKMINGNIKQEKANKIVLDVESIDPSGAVVPMSGGNAKPSPNKTR